MLTCLRRFQFNFTWALLRGKDKILWTDLSLRPNRIKNSIWCWRLSTILNRCCKTIGHSTWAKTKQSISSHHHSSLLWAQQNTAFINYIFWKHDSNINKRNPKQTHVHHIFPIENSKIVKNEAHSALGIRSHGETAQYRSPARVKLKCSHFDEYLPIHPSSSCHH